MPYSQKTIEEKPYNMCLNCMHIGKRCDGPNFLAMTVERWCEWCRLRKEYLGWSNAHVAEQANVSKISVDRIMSSNVKDLRISTMQAVTRILVNGSWGQYPCAMAATRADGEDAAVTQCARLKDEITALRAQHKEEMEKLRSETDRMVQFLREQVKFKEEQMLAKDKLLETITHLIDVGKK